MRVAVVAAVIGPTPTIALVHISLLHSRFKPFHKLTFPSGTYIGVDRAVVLVQTVVPVVMHIVVIVVVAAIPA